MTRRLLEDLPDRTEWFNGYDEETDTTSITVEYKDTHKVLEHNKAIQGKDAGKVKDDDAPGWWHVARIPPYLVDKWAREGFDVFDPNNGPEVLRRLDSNEYRHLRVNTGVIGVRKAMI